MLITQSDFTIAKYNSLEEISLKEIKKADMVLIRSYVEAGLYHSESARWIGEIGKIKDPREFFRSKREAKASLKIKKLFENEGYCFKTIPVTESVFKEFKELYKNTTLKKQRPLYFDLESAILGRVRTKRPIFLSGMFKEKKLISALVFAVYKKQAIVSFGAKTKFPKRRGGAGGILEYELLKFSLENGIQRIVHGRSTNPAGIYTNAGLFEFKARYGFSAFPEGAWQTMFVKNPKITLSDLVFVTIIGNQVGYLIVSDKAEKEIKKKYATKEVNNVGVISTKEVKKQHDNLVGRF